MLNVIWLTNNMIVTIAFCFHVTKQSSVVSLGVLLSGRQTTYLGTIRDRCKSYPLVGFNSFEKYFSALEQCYASAGLFDLKRGIQTLLECQWIKSLVWASIEGMPRNLDTLCRIKPPITRTKNFGFIFKFLFVINKKHFRSRLRFRLPMKGDKEG